MKAASWLGLGFRGTRCKNRRSERNTWRERRLEVNCGSVKRRKNGEGWIAAAIGFAPGLMVGGPTKGVAMP